MRSILTLIALLSVIVLWSEIHSAFAFLENIKLWNASSTVQGVESLHPITLGSVLIAILIFFITTQLVRNMPALLELALLQHLSLTPGTGYAITTLTKYLLLLIGGLMGFSMIGIEWSKLQWLVAALGVGLGFGLREIFANFISGLIILFEKPIRIGDTVTIRDLTGSITRINTRATTITDWDRKEIIVPNKAFITEQFVNWSLSDSVTRVVLTVPAPAGIDSEQVTALLRHACERCSYVLDTPPPEVFWSICSRAFSCSSCAFTLRRWVIVCRCVTSCTSSFCKASANIILKCRSRRSVRMETAAKRTPASNGAPTTRTFKSGGL